jgi:hypothetical protein
MELRGEVPRFNVIAKTVEGRKAALVGLSKRFGRSMVARCLDVAQWGYLAASLRLNFDNLEGRMGGNGQFAPPRASELKC